MTDSLTIAIPTYQREHVLLDSIRGMLCQTVLAAEILIVDQSTNHSPDTVRQLQRMEKDGRIRWIRLNRPSIPHAMNTALLAAKSKIVLFLDDDIVPDTRLVEMHLGAQADEYLVAGMVLQPGEQPLALGPDEQFRFNSDSRVRISEFMGGNFSIRCDKAIALGGFDENFMGAAYRFEAEFAHRYVNKHGRFLYEPRAFVRHLQVAAGGTRAHGHHLRTMRPTHSAGIYYELLRTKRPGWLRQMAWRPLRAVRTRHHVLRPWWIPITLLAEVRGLSLAMKLNRSGPKLLEVSGPSPE